MKQGNSKSSNSCAKEEYEIQFEEIRAGIKNVWSEQLTKEQTTNQKKQPISGRYNSLYEEICHKCNPANFMDSYTPELLDTVHELYLEAIVNRDDNNTLKKLRRKIIQRLGVRFSTEIIYKDLTTALNPCRFIGDSEKFKIANNLYNQTLLNADDIEKLETIFEVAKEKELYNINKLNGSQEDNNYILILLLVLSLPLLFLLSILFISCN